MHQYDVIVIGVGAMGSAACFELARRGMRVLGIEQFDVPNDLGSSHGLSRMIRLAYYEHPDYVPLLLRAYERWEELERLGGEKLLYLTGGLYMGPRNSELVEGSLHAATQHRLEHQLLSGGQIVDRFGLFHLPHDWMGLLEQRAGFLIPEKAIEVCARLARAAGARIHEREKVLDWSADGAGARVTTDHGNYHANRILFTAGPWTGKLLRDLGVKLTVTRQLLFWFNTPNRADFELGRIPVWGVDRRGGGLYYGFPILPGEPGVKIACHWPAETTDPDQVVRNLKPDEDREVAQMISRHLPATAGPLADFRVCMYTNTPDSHFILDHHPSNDRILLAAGFSGHGFKFASVMGEILADLAMTGRTSLPAQFLSLRRFGMHR